MDSAPSLQARIRADLKSAMQGRRGAEVRTLRTLLAAIDNAQAVPVGDRHETYVVRSFGDAGVEIPRLELTAETLAALLRRECAERLAAAKAMLAAGQEARAAVLQDEARIVERYIG